VLSFHPLARLKRQLNRNVSYIYFFLSN
jgi:hypothetical protein